MSSTRASYAAFLRRATGGDSHQRRSYRRAQIHHEAIEPRRRYEETNSAHAKLRALVRPYVDAREAGYAWVHLAPIGEPGPLFCPLERLEPEARPLSEMQSAWIEWLKWSRWTFFVTVTWRPRAGVDWGRGRTAKDWGPSEEVLMKAVHRLLRRMHVDCFGLDFREKVGLTYLIALEHTRNRLHAHLLVSGGVALQLALFKPWAKWWQKNFGRIEFDKPRQEDMVMRYVTKYATKNGDLEPFFTWQEETKRMRAATWDNGEVIPRGQRAMPCKKCNLVSECICDRVNEDQLALFHLQQETATAHESLARESAVPRRKATGAVILPGANDLERARANRKTVPEILSRRAARRRERYHRYMSRSSTHATVERSPAAAPHAAE
jgi:hypothetical protein